ncbi:MAG TPA: glycosyltransferase family 39 protein [Pirellulales bacterium]|nr:glycosyltransferase family 39 protein [Pirellulales bacterium]
MPSILHRAHRPGRPPQTACLPNAAPTAVEPWLSASQSERLIWAFVALAIITRGVRFLLRFPLWEDECFLVSNFIDRDFANLLEPLNYHQVAPLGFLAAELAAVKLLGFNEWSLRLVPFAAGIASVLLFRRLAGQLVEGPAKLIAVATFCASYSGIRYAAEAKPYGVDLVVSLVLLTFAVEWWRKGRTAWLIVLTACVPLAVLLSYPACFVAGGLSAFMAVVLIVEDRRGWAAWAAFNAALAASFLLMLRVAAKGQAEAELGWMQDYWKDHLPSLAAPGQLLWWLLTTHTGDLLAIPIGGGRGASAISFLLVACGVAALVRTRRYTLLTLLLMPAALNLTAALMGRFPYGGHVKFSQYLAPAICLLIGVGGGELVAMGRGAVAVRRRNLAVALSVLALIPLVTMARDFAKPYKSPTDARYRDFARWFWSSAEFRGEAACLHTDLDLEFAPGTFHHLGWSAMYVCNQRIYSPRHRRGEPVAWERISAGWPLHCVEYRAQVYKYDDDACQAWLDRMAERYHLVSRDTIPSPVFDQREHKLLCTDELVIYKFVPLTAGEPPVVSPISRRYGASCSPFPQPMADLPREQTAGWDRDNRRAEKISPARRPWQRWRPDQSAGRGRGVAVARVTSATAGWLID